MARRALLAIGTLLPCLFAGTQSAFAAASVVPRSRIRLNRQRHAKQIPHRHRHVDLRSKNLESGLLKASGELSDSSQSNGSWTERVQNFRKFADKNFFLVGMFVAVALARAFPALGKNGGILRPELIIGRSRSSTSGPTNFGT